ncbi:MAG: glycosyltransferase [Chitinophagaceae bacterium]
MSGGVQPPKIKILVAPLDWGLGHATRCIPVIKQLLASGCEVLLAGERRTETLLRTEFPQLTFLPLKGYRINYGKNKWMLLSRIFLQTPKILKTIAYENSWLKEVIKKYKIHAVISDNRHGLYNATIYCVFITHQLLIKTSLGKTADALLQKINYKYIHQFNECWIPDVDLEITLAGELAHPSVMPKIPVQYVGLLSRFKYRQLILQAHYILVLLSGPEPQRTILEKKILAELVHNQQPVLFIRGLPGNKESPPVPRHVTIYNHLSTNALQQAMEQASFIISRCGYSTVMDVMTMQKKSILIPTPGQAEQEYLAKHLMKQQFAFCVTQSKFKLQKAIELAGSFHYQFEGFKNSALKDTINELVLKSQKRV